MRILPGRDGVVAAGGVRHTRRVIVGGAHRLVVLAAVGAIGETAANVRRLLGCVTDSAVVLVSSVLKATIYIDLLGTSLKITGVRI